jgi:hypothetical protein
MTLLLPLDAGRIATGFIRKNGRYVRYNGGYARDLDLCDCVCGEGPTTCCCDDLPDTLYGRVTKYVWKADCSGAEIVTIDFELTKGDTCRPECPGAALPGDSCVNGRWCGYFEQQGCWLGTPVTWDSLIALDCESTGGGTMSMGVWYQQQVDMVGTWGGCSYETFGDFTCPPESLCKTGFGSLPINSLCIQTTPF